MKVLDFPWLQVSLRDGNICSKMLNSPLSILQSAVRLQRKISHALINSPAYWRHGFIHFKYKENQVVDLGEISSLLDTRTEKVLIDDVRSEETYVKNSCKVH